LLLTDLRLPGKSGLEVIRRAKDIRPEIISIILTGYGSLESAVEAVKEANFDYLPTPVTSDILLTHVKRAIEYYNLKRENSSLRDVVKERFSYANIIGKSDSMVEIYEIISKVADTDSTILLQGESGTGKELIAKSIHHNSSRRDYPFVPVNCGAIPAELLESELFGHEKGAFTGAIATRLGRFERAHKGTLFLDEISEMPLPLQVKLLRVLQEREFERVGGNRTIEVDVRIISASNRDLEDALEKQSLREDLYYRLNVIPIVIPPLRHRKDDIPILLAHFLENKCRQRSRAVDGISDEAMETFLNYRWPGNIREMENIVERIVILKQDSGPIISRDIPAKLKKIKDLDAFPLEIPEGGIKLAEFLYDLENMFIEKALGRTGGVKSKAAELLGINRTTLIEKLKKKSSLTLISQQSEART
ncbi:MAG: sigma-54-dependent Fis family transcriptional regulator, partial [Deltaproteobacteria bacterium]|nr:sigma-54-dependent Fis family transcriptional regulator [Deltaproteobacteria bacterium]